jgi:hypothetical protein
MPPETRVNYLEKWKRKSDGRMVFIASVSEFTDVTIVSWRRPGNPRTHYGRLEIDSFLKRYEFVAPGPEVRLPLEFPPAPKTQYELDLVLMMLKAERDYWGSKANVWRLVAGDEYRAEQALQRAVALKKQYREFEEKWGAPGVLPVAVFEPEFGGTYQHAEGFGYKSWRVREKAPNWEYRIIGTDVAVVEVDGGNQYGLLLAVRCSCTKFREQAVAGPSQWPLEHALSFAHRHWVEKHVFDQSPSE